MPVMSFSIARAFWTRLLGIFLLHDRIGIRASTLSSQADQRIFCDAVDLDGFEAISVVGAENLAQVLHRNTILRAARPGQAWFDGAQVEFEQIIKLWLRGVIFA